MDIPIPNLNPSPKQIEFFTSKADETFYGGQAGGGKTSALVAEAITSCLEDPGHHTYIFRKTLKELEQSVVPEIYKQLDVFRDNVKYNSQKNIFTFPKTSFIQLAYLDNEADKYRYQSAEIHTLLFDELTHFTQDQYEYIKTRVRSDKPRRMRVMSASNPGNVGHGWVKAYFIDPAPPMTMFNDGEITKKFIPASIDDHPVRSFRDSYKKQLNALSDEMLKKALLYGEWDLFAGQVFTEWRRGIHVYDDTPVDFGACDRYIGLDWGYNDPTAIYWVARTPEAEDGRHYYVYRELYGNMKRPEEWAYEIAEIVKTEPVEFLAMPHDTYSNQGGSRPIVDQFREVFDRLNVRITIVRAPSGTHADKISRQALMHQMLATSYLNKPYLQVHNSCLNLIRTLPMLNYDTTRSEEIDKNADDHAYDGLTYCLYSIAKGGKGQVVTTKQPGQKREPMFVDENGRVINAGLDDIMVKAVKDTMQPRGRDWVYRR